jgi:hypothetical protein
MSQNPRERRHGGHPKKPPGTHNNSPEELAAINKTLIALSEQYDAGKPDPKRENARFRIERWTLFGIGIYTLLTAGLVGVALYQLRFTSDQIGIMRETEINQLRPYLHVLRTAVTYVEAQDGPMKVTVHPTYQVFNQTPASNVLPSWNIDVQEFPMTDHFPFVWGPFPTVNTTVDAPGQERFVEPRERIISADEIKKINAGTHRLFVYGTIAYVDVFKIARYTNFCFYFDIAGIKERKANNCPIHNGADWFTNSDSSTTVNVPMK